MTIDRRQLRNLINESILDMFIPGSGRARDVARLRQSLENLNQSQEDAHRSKETDNEMILDLIMQLLIKHGKIKGPSRPDTVSYLNYLARTFR